MSPDTVSAAFLEAAAVQHEAESEISAVDVPESLKSYVVQRTLGLKFYSVSEAAARPPAGRRAARNRKCAPCCGRQARGHFGAYWQPLYSNISAPGRFAQTAKMAALDRDHSAGGRISILV